jgi:hypothetical protein
MTLRYRLRHSRIAWKRESYSLHEADRAWRRRMWLAWLAGMCVAVLWIVG